MSEKTPATTAGNDSAWLLYILECSDGSLYTGITNDIERRVREHNEGTGARYTRSRRPVKLRYQEPCESRSAALIRECAIRLMSPKEKRALIARYVQANTGST
ncbi:MAG: GIY-YIG nuclease family protein [Gammaproteobacteria bacterium]|nr:GIY-YIG nuclease family protein [Gammaproteobacteria bacterium]